jgi:hypothetical protein
MSAIRVWTGRFLADRGRPGDLDRARDLAVEAGRTAGARGYGGVLRDAEAVLSDLGDDGASPPAQS